MTAASIALSIARAGLRAVGSRARIGRGYWRRTAFGDAQWRNQHCRYASFTAVQALTSLAVFECPRQDSNLRSRLRRPLLSPLSYGGSGLRKITSPDGTVAQPAGGTVTAQTLAGFRPASTERTSPFRAREVAGTAAETLPSRPWRRDWDACSWWTTMR
jgi:hypothetical protein